MTKKLVTKPTKKKSSKTASMQQKKSKKANRFTFRGILSKFQEKYNDFGEDLIGFILKDIREMPSKSLIADEQWFNRTEKFKMAFESYTDEELLGKEIEFEGLKESHKKGYYTYQGSVLISNSEDLEHKILRPENVKVL